MKQTAIQAISREHVTSTQLTNLLNAFSITTAFLLNAHDSEHSHEGGPLDGGTKAAAEVAVISICSRIESMMAEPERWSLKSHNDLETALLEAYRQTTETAKHQAQAFAGAQLPHHTFTPQFAKLNTGAWVAYYGDLADLDNAIVGVGETPEQAVRAFDDIFSGQTPEHLAQLLERHEQQKNLDENGTEHTGETPGGGKIEPGDSTLPWADPQNGGTGGS